MKLTRIWILSVVWAACLYLTGCAGHVENVEAVKQAREQLVLPEKPDSTQLASIVRASRIWGFAKYHHPAFSTDTVSADAEYFKLLNNVLQAPDSLQSKVYAEWIASLGPFSVRKNEKQKTLEVFNDFRWIADTLTLGRSLSQTLQQLRQADCRKNNYVGQNPVNVSYLEPAYQDLPKEDLPYRLLGVVKFWNAVDSYSPNRNLTDKPWDKVLDEYVAMAFDRTVTFSQLYSRIGVDLCDTHVNTWFIPVFGGRFVPLLCRFAEDRLFVNDTCTLVPNGFQVGDEILRIDSVRPMDRLKELAPYMAHSNRAALLRDGAYATLLTGKKEVQIEYSRKGKVFTVNMPSVEAEKFTGRIYANIYSSGKSKFEEVADGVALVRINSLTCDDEKELEELLQKHNRLIIDLRGYPAQFEVIHELLPEYFFSAPREAVQTLLPQADCPGKYLRMHSNTMQTSDPDKLFKGKTVLLVNASTQSMGEFFTMFLQTIPGVVTMGSQTAGADGNVTFLPVPYFRFNLTGLGVLYPDGTNAQRNGVKIDVVVEPTAEGLMQGKDEEVQAAVDYLQGKEK